MSKVTWIKLTCKAQFFSSARVILSCFFPSYEYMLIVKRNTINHLISKILRFFIDFERKKCLAVQLFCLPNRIIIVDNFDWFKLSYENSLIQLAKHYTMHIYIYILLLYSFKRLIMLKLDDTNVIKITYLPIIAQ